MARVLYVMGLYRSGSTILDILLSNQRGLVGVGELRNLPLSGWDHASPCACGQSADACEFWCEVRSLWEKKTGGATVARLAELQETFERLRSFPRLLREMVNRSGEFKEYGALIVPLYEAIAEVGGSEAVVDSTKYPARALALLRTPGMDIRIVHLVRDGRAVIWSMKRLLNTDLKGEVLEVPPDRVAPHTARQWLLTNLASEFVARVAGRRAVRVRYEDFVQDPTRELARIGRIADVDTSELAKRVSNGDVLEIGHTIAGNRVRMGGPVRLRADTEWREKLPAEDRDAFWRSAGWLARHYGYSRI